MARRDSVETEIASTESGRGWRGRFVYAVAARSVGAGSSFIMIILIEERSIQSNVNGAPMNPGMANAPSSSPSIGQDAPITRSMAARRPSAAKQRQRKAKTREGVSTHFHEQAHRRIVNHLRVINRYRQRTKEHSRRAPQDQHAHA